MCIRDRENIATNKKSGSFFVSGGNGVDGIEWYRNGSGRLQVFIGGSTIISGSTILSNDFLTPDTITISRVSGVITARVNGISQGSSVNSSTLKISTLAQRPMGAWSNHASLYFYSLLVGVLHNWNPTASSHAAGTPILTDTIGGNNATGVNMPTDGSAWINLGGGISIPVIMNQLRNQGIN